MVLLDVQLQRNQPCLRQPKAMHPIWPSAEAVQNMQMLLALNEDSK